ncbi:MAG: hypothetical protein H8D95_01175 [Candidatus Endolissoclinum sp.]|nr:hypothetical protein [Candidatus Endolissoclinum sp.]
MNLDLSNKLDNIKDAIYGKTKIELERDKKYESRWVWYHTFLAAEIFVTNILLIIIIYKL